MELLDINLHDLVKTRKKLSSVTIKKIARMALLNIRRLHRLGFVHCDVKPANLMLDLQGDVHLIDFALAERYLDSKGEHVPPQQRR